MIKQIAFSGVTALTASAAIITPIMMSKTHLEISKGIKQVSLFSKDKTNVVVFFNDAVTNFDAFDVAMERKDQYKDFTVFPNTFSQGNSTNSGVPGIMGGGDYSVYANNVVDSTVMHKDYFANAFGQSIDMYEKNNFETSLVSAQVWDGQFGIGGNQNDSHSYTSLKKEEVDIQFPNNHVTVTDFESLYAETTGKDVLHTVNGQHKGFAGREFYKDFPQRINAEDTTFNTAKYFFYEGTHQTYTDNRNGNWYSDWRRQATGVLHGHKSSRGSVDLALDLEGDVIQEMKDNGVYDNSLIIFVSDHGTSIDWKDASLENDFKTDEGKNFFNKMRTAKLQATEDQTPPDPSPTLTARGGAPVKAPDKNQNPINQTNNAPVKDAIVPSIKDDTLKDDSSVPADVKTYPDQKIDLIRNSAQLMIKLPGPSTQTEIKVDERLMANSDIGVIIKNVLKDKINGRGEQFDENVFNHDSRYDKYTNYIPNPLTYTGDRVINSFYTKWILINREATKYWSTLEKVMQISGGDTKDPLAPGNINFIDW